MSNEAMVLTRSTATDTALRIVQAPPALFLPAAPGWEIAELERVAWTVSAYGPGCTCVLQPVGVRAPETRC